MLQFNFKKPIAHVLSNVLLCTFPGIDKLWIISEDSDNELFTLKEAHKNTPEPQLIQQVEINKVNFLNTKYFYRWISLNEAPLTSDKESKKQFNIFDEYKNRILHLYLPENSNGFFLFYIFFNKEQVITGAHTDSRLTTDNKQFVAHTIYHMLSYELKRYESDNKVASYLQKMQLRMTNYNQTHLQEFVKSFILKYLSQAEQSHGISIKINPNALNYLISQPITSDEIKQLLDEAISWGINFLTSSSDEGFTIEVSHVLKEYKYVENKLVITEKIHESKFTRAYDFLERMEKAAQKVVQNGQKLIGRNVGQASEPKITAPGITDALKKHQKKIHMLVKLYPNRWPIIRTQFQPLLNVLENEDIEKNNELYGS